jgi:ADP-ribose pyrophosphatase YjhB (NUDIX family)
MAEALPRIDIHRHCPRCGSPRAAPRSPQLLVCEACDLHLYFNPCAAAAAILLDDSGRVLLVRRAHEPAKDKLAFPGGFIDDGESAETALRRELREEIGMEVGPLHYVASHPNTYPYRGVVYATLDVFFTARVPDFAAAVALDGVAGLVVLPAAAVAEQDLAFESMRVAWRAFLATGSPAGLPDSGPRHP